VRESDGLAMSSRNVNLTPDERVQAGVLHRALKRAREEVRVRRAVTPAALRAVVLQCFQSAPAARLDYVEFFDPGSLQPVRKVTPGMHMALAVRFSRTRLIDNGRL